MLLEDFFNNFKRIEHRNKKTKQLVTKTVITTTTKTENQH